MFAGFDYGTSNCAIACMLEGQAKLIPLEGQASFMPSTLYAHDRSLIVEAVLSNITDVRIRNQYAKSRENGLRKAASMRRELNLQDGEKSWFMGSAAIDNYIDYPGEGWFVKSPKSFLGVTGLGIEHSLMFEDLVTLMMQNVKLLAQQKTEHNFDQVVIGRPINFQGIGGEECNKTAMSILFRAAKTAGFKDIEFFYEPIAAGIDFESQLKEDKTVLVLDVGGGTSDCSLIRMGPSYIDKANRQDDFLAHSGVRVGGNDLDISLNFLELMLLLGRNSELKNGLPIPAQYFSNAAKINDVNAQSIFSSQKYSKELDSLVKNAKQPELLRRLNKLQKYKQNYHLARSAELCKIGLSKKSHHEVDLSFIENDLKKILTIEDFECAVEKPLQSITGLISDVIKQSNTLPDIVYLTGGSSKSPTIHRAVRNCLRNTPIAEGDSMGSVVAGLAKWAQRIFSG